MSKVVTVQDYLIAKDPEKYKPIFKAQQKAAEKAEKKDDEKRLLLAEIERLEGANAELRQEIEELKKKKKKEE